MAFVHAAAADRRLRNRVDSDVSVELKTGELLQLGSDPARLLTVIDHVGKRRPSLHSSSAREESKKLVYLIVAPW